MKPHIAIGAAFHHHSSSLYCSSSNTVTIWPCHLVLSVVAATYDHAPLRFTLQYSFTYFTPTPKILFQDHVRFHTHKSMLERCNPSACQQNIPCISFFLASIRNIRTPAFVAQGATSQRVVNTLKFKPLPCRMTPTSPHHVASCVHVTRHYHVTY